MGFTDFFRSFLMPKGSFTLKECEFYELSIESYYKRLAIDTSINLIANAIVRSKFNTYEKGKKVRANNYYLFNVQPNKNQNASEYMHRFVSNLIYNNEALVVMIGEELHIADSWNVKEFALRENLYSDVFLGNLKLDKTFNESEVLSYKLNNSRIISLIDGLYESFGKILAASMHSYKSGNSMRALVEIESTQALTDEAQAARDDLFNNQFKSFFKSEGGAVLPFTKGMKYTEIKGHHPNSRDLRALIDDVFDIVSMALHIPKGLLKGDLADVDSQVDSFLMLGVNPIVEIINDENNRKMYSKQEYLDRTYMQIDTSLIKYVDIAKMATALDKMLSSGLTNVNENRERMGYEPIEEEWANKHFITKNYQEVEDYLTNGQNGVAQVVDQSKGGEKR